MVYENKALIANNPPEGIGPTGVPIGQPLPSPKPSKGYSERLTSDKTGGGY